MRTTLILCILTIALSSQANETFYLKDSKTGDVAGPFMLANGASVKLGEAKYTFIKRSRKKLTINQKLDQTIIPEIRFNKIGVLDVIAHLKQASFDWSPSSIPEEQGVNIIVNIPDHTAKNLPAVTFNARQLTLRESLRTIMNISGLKYRIERNVIWIEAKK